MRSERRTMGVVNQIHHYPHGQYCISPVTLAVMICPPTYITKQLLICRGIMDSGISCTAHALLIMS